MALAQNIATDTIRISREAFLPSDTSINGTLISNIIAQAEIDAIAAAEAYADIAIAGALETAEEYTDNAIANIPSSGAIRSVVVPWSAFNYFTTVIDGSWLVKVKTDVLNGDPYSGGSGATDYGTRSFYIPSSGTYRFSMSYGRQFNSGKIKVIIDPGEGAVEIIVNTYIDDVKLAGSYDQELTLTAGVHELNLQSAANDVNVNAWIMLMGDGMYFTKV